MGACLLEKLTGVFTTCAARADTCGLINLDSRDWDTALLAEAETATDPERIADIHVRLADMDAHSAPARIMPRPEAYTSPRALPRD